MAARWFALEREPQLGAQLGLVLKELSRLPLDDHLQPCQRVFGRIRSKKGVHLDLWIGSGKQCPTVREVTISRGTSDRRLGGGRLDGGSHPSGKELPRSGDKGIPRASLLTGTSCM